LLLQFSWSQPVWWLYVQSVCSCYCRAGPVRVHVHLLVIVQNTNKQNKRLQNLFVRSDGPSFDVIPKTVTPTIAKWHFRSNHSQRLSITLRCLATGNNSEDLKFIGITSQSIGITVLETWLLRGRQTVTEYCAILSTDCSIYCAIGRPYNKTVSAILLTVLGYKQSLAWHTHAETDQTTELFRGDM
jgi:hypothetical protein